MVTRNEQRQHGGAHVLLVPLPAQGHTNPMLEFGRRLAYHGLRPTLVLTRFVLSTGPPPGDPFRVAAISDGFDAGGMGSCPDPVEYCRRAEAVGTETLAQVIAAEARARRAPSVVVYDPHMPWARRVARAAGLPTAAFMSQSCAVDLVYGNAWAGRLPLPMADGGALRRRGVVSVDLAPEDLSPFVVSPELYPKYLDVSIRQFEDLEEVDDVFVNSFRGHRKRSTWSRDGARRRSAQRCRPSFSTTAACRRTGPTASTSTVATRRAWHGWSSSNLAQLYWRPMGRSIAWTPPSLTSLGMGSAIPASHFSGSCGPTKNKRYLKHYVAGARTMAWLYLGVPSSRLFLDTLRMEFDDGSNSCRRADGGNATVGGPANQCKVCGERMGDWRADAAQLERPGE